MNKVEITRFSKLPAVDQNNGCVYRPFTVSIQNKGSNDAGGLTLVARMLGNDNSELGRTTEQFSRLSPIAGREVTIGMLLPYDTGLGNTRISYVAALKIGDLVFDENRLP